jgi:hypothetical protein
MSSEQDERFAKMFAGSLPPRGTTAHQAILKTLANNKTPAIDAYAKKQFEIFTSTRFAVANNGIGFSIDGLLRYYVDEFNHRSATSGLYSMPTSFGFMEAFLEYKKPLFIFLPKPEINILCSFIDFLDWTTSNDQAPDTNNLKNSIGNNQCYLFSNTANPDLLKFKCKNSVEVSVISAAVVRDRSEMVVVLQIAESEPGDHFEYDELESRKSLKQLMPFWAKQKEGLSISDDYVHERVRPEGQLAGFVSIAMIRYDIERQAIVDRALYQDWGDQFRAFVDVVQVFGAKDFENLSPEQRKLYNAGVASCNEYQEVFELCRHFALLPYFAASYAEHTKQYDQPTELRSVSSGLKDKRLLEKALDETKVFIRRVNKIEVPRDTLSGEILIKITPYSYEDSGYWRLLSPWEQGVEKQGLTEQGRTWIKQDRPIRAGRETHELKPSIQSNHSAADQTRSTFGYIYVMRSAQHAKDVFKVGLTTRETSTRAKELTSSTSSVDQFGVMQEWEVSDCRKAEAAIHQRLDAFRVNPKREFFKCDYRHIFMVIHEIVEKVNSNSQ